MSEDSNAPKSSPESDPNSTSVDEESTADVQAVSPATPLPQTAPVARGGASKGSLGIVALLIAVFAAGGGWMARDVQAKKTARGGELAPKDGSGPCAAWEKQVCQGAGDKTAACVDAKSAAAMLPDSACGAALADVPATLAKVKAARADCTTLVGKLCGDLGPESDLCKLVRERTEAFPPSQCSEMLSNYDSVIGGLKQMQQQRMGGMGMGHPGGPPPGPNPHALQMPGSGAMPTPGQ